MICFQQIMDHKTTPDRRGFLRSAAGLGSGLLMASEGIARPLTEKEKLARIASNTWPIRYIFKSRMFRNNPTTEAMKKKYGEITMLDFPQFTKDTFPGVYHMDLFSGLFGDMSDDTMYTQVAVRVNDVYRTTHRVRSVERLGKEVAGEDGEQDGRHRHAMPAHFEQRAPRYLRTRRRETQGGHRGSEEMAGRCRDARRQIHAREQRRSAHRAPGPLPQPTIPRATS